MEPIKQRALPPAPPSSCQQHPDNPLDLFCVTCDAQICAECLTQSPTHRRHMIDSLRVIQDESTQRMESVAGTFRALALANDENSRMLQSVRSFESDLLGQIGRLVLNAQEYVAGIHQKVAQQEVGWKSYLEKHAAEMVPGGLVEGCCGPPSLAVVKKEDCPKEKQRPIIPVIDMRQSAVNLKSDALCNVVISYEYGITWNMQFTPQQDSHCELTISCRTAEECPQFEGNFQLRLDVIRPEDQSVFTIRKSLKGLTMRRFFVIPTPTMIDTTELENKGFLTKEGKMTVRVGIGPEDAQTERHCLLTEQKLLQQRIDALQDQLKRSNFTIGTLSIADYFAETDGQFHSKPVLTPNGSRWTLRLKLNQGGNNSNRTHVGVQIVKCGPNSTKHEFFVELVHGTRAGISLRLAGSGLVDAVEEPRFIEKKRLEEEFLVDGKRLEMGFGVREWVED
uniref:(northern house mosquito) hypothetical protein n=1 Tax=Culex pipiens TaxID=7175 RepID=A0A8D8NQJ9_CULPI